MPSVKIRPGDEVAVRVELRRNGRGMPKLIAPVTQATVVDLRSNGKCVVQPRQKWAVNGVPVKRRGPERLLEVKRSQVLGPWDEWKAAQPPSPWKPGPSERVTLTAGPPAPMRLVKAADSRRPVR